MTANIATTIRDLRESCGMTQDALAVKAGVRQQAISKIESGQCSPRWDTVRRLLLAMRAKASSLEAPLQQ